MPICDKCKKEFKQETNLFKIIEQEFGRLLTPMECSQIIDWQICYQDDIVIEAIKTAVLNGKFNFKYIDRILLNWDKNNLRTIREVKEQEKAFNEKKLKVVNPEVIEEKKEQKELTKQIDLAANNMKRFLSELEKPNDGELIEVINNPIFNYGRSIKEPALIKIGLERLLSKVVFGDEATRGVHQSSTDI